MFDRLRESVSEHRVAYFILICFISIILAFLIGLPYCLTTSFSKDSLVAVALLAFIILGIAISICYEDDGLEYM